MTLEFDSVAAAVAEVRATPQRRPVRVDPGRRLDRDGFHAFCAAHPEVQAELLPDGTLELMSPQTMKSNRAESRVFYYLMDWFMRGGGVYGEVFGPSMGYTLPDGSVRSPDASWVGHERLAGLAEGEQDRMPRLVPDFVIEVMSKTDELKRAKAKMSDTWMANGVRLGWLLRPSVQQVLIYRAGATEPEIVKGFDGALSADEVVPGFSLDLTLLR